MRILRWGAAGSERPGMVDAAGTIRDVSTIVQDIHAAELATTLRSLSSASLESLPIVDSAQRLGPPLRGIGKIICIGLNYADHARETGQAPPAEPIIFLKATSSIVGPNDDIVLPADAQKGDWEVELGIVIGKEAKYVSADDAMNYVAGFCVINDVSERSYQLERGGQWDKGKGCDTFCPIGPYLVTPDEIQAMDSLQLSCAVNGRTVQNGNTRDMIFGVPFLVHYISQFMSLQPGDIISSGTPHGVGMGMKPPQWLQENDVVELAIDGLGSQRQHVTRYPSCVMT